VHGANGYLLDQFVRDGTNHRTDAYGGTVAKRARLPIEVAEAVASVWGPGLVGYKVSPHSTFNSMSDSDPEATFTFLARELSRLGLGYLAVVEAIRGKHLVPASRRVTARLRAAFEGALVVNDGYDGASGQEAVASGAADLVAYASSFLANPDLPRRFREQAPLNVPDSSTFYAGEEKGYVDYSALDDLYTAVDR
jgi:N-ethylmaleimide reductase